MMKTVKMTTNSTLSPRHRKIKQRYILVLAEALWLGLFLMVGNHLNALGAIVIPAVISTIICLWVSRRLNRLKRTPPDDFVLSTLLPFGGGLTFEICITAAILVKFAGDTIQSVKTTMTLCQVCLFVLSVALIWVHSRTDQLQYVLYAVAYFVAVILEWLNMAGFNPLSFFDIDLKFSIPFFILPLKEAMLLYIILDVALQAVARKHMAGDKEHEA